MNKLLGTLIIILSYVLFYSLLDEVTFQDICIIILGGLGLLIGNDFMSKED